MKKWPKWIKISATVCVVFICYYTFAFVVGAIILSPKDKADIMKQEHAVEQLKTAAEEQG